MYKIIIKNGKNNINTNKVHNKNNGVNGINEFNNNIKRIANGIENNNNNGLHNYSGSESSSSSSVNSKNLNIRKRKHDINFNIVNKKNNNFQDTNKRRKLKGKEPELEEECKKDEQKIIVHCPICLEEPTADIVFCNTCCGHIFCESCLNSYLKIQQKKQYPICRQSFKNKKNYKNRIYFC
ncbi:hypothetical protein PIROE2DRAFT_10628 [Piromyces sp. E2]|nr:hypothetical protein PIROE2DRAFT_10628 [Piromyces sp. E2]|eukprot:OUM62940.1 hypothetical protein PIROE2DRAFT_10628 [Piromyces sp. E2]